MTTNGDICYIANIYIRFVSGESKSVGNKHKSRKLSALCMLWTQALVLRGWNEYKDVKKYKFGLAGQDCTNSQACSSVWLV